MLGVVGVTKRRELIAFFDKLEADEKKIAHKFTRQERRARERAIKKRRRKALGQVTT